MTISKRVSVLFNEPKLLKLERVAQNVRGVGSFSALQRAEIAETLQRDETGDEGCRFSALQRAEIAETTPSVLTRSEKTFVSVLFNEPKLLKQLLMKRRSSRRYGFSALQRAEIAETSTRNDVEFVQIEFQCSSTSRNC